MTGRSSELHVGWGRMDVFDVDSGRYGILSDFSTMLGLRGVDRVNSRRFDMQDMQMFDVLVSGSRVSQIAFNGGLT
ncbi:hypothetical protein Trydic_g19626 [Trypoxylus dichotomus]